MAPPRICFDASAVSRRTNPRGETSIPQVGAALTFLHRRSVVHGDVKSANVLLGPGGAAKISDFGLARVVGTAGFTRASSARGGTAGYMAPELGEAGALDRDGESADVFAFATLLAEVASGLEPFADARNEVQIALRVRDGERPPIPVATPPRLREALLRCWDSNAITRPDARDLLFDLLDMRLDAPGGAAATDVEAVRVDQNAGCPLLSSILAENGLRSAIPEIIRENEVDMEAARLMDPEDWQEIGLDAAAARTVVSSLSADKLVLRVTVDGRGQQHARPAPEVVELPCRPTDRVEDVLTWLKERVDADTKYLRLYRQVGKSVVLLREDHTLFEAGVRGDADLKLRRSYSPPAGVAFPLFVRLMTGKTLTVTVESSFTLKALFHMALEEIGDSVENDYHYRIERHGRFLFATETTLDNIDIRKEDTIFMVRRMLN